MSDEASGKPPAGSAGSNPFSQNVPYSPVSARVPERVSRGTFATHFILLTGHQELAIDFLLHLAPPFLLGARVVLPYSTMEPMIRAIGENIENYRKRFGAAPPAPPPPPPNVPQPNLAEIYENLKISDEVAVGAYANTLMISHTATDFCLDFILDLFPRPVVTQRVYLSAPQVPNLLNTLKRTLEQIQQRIAQQQQQTSAPPPPTPPATPG